MSFGPSEKPRNTLDRWVRSRWTTPALALGEVLETTILPWPIEAPLAALMFAHRKRIPLYLAVVVASTLVGSALMYWAGYHAADALSGNLPFLSEQDMQAYEQRYADAGFWTIVSGGVFPVPWQIVTLSAGAAGYNFGLFMLASLIGRGLRFGLLAAAVALFGPQITEFWKNSSKIRKTAIWVLAIAAVCVWILLLFL
ncbi:YqaA family protein [Euryhalocaulis caribicus]|uniref:YqaA family protein n=1 Tax=Euryhalocaulis caribicus TaxID=1161401 RepID=UPI00039E78D1|nr:VTT domain-containing protein [Euryhalocaulis caribicus]